MENAAAISSANKVLARLIDCKPKKGASCEKATQIGKKVRKLYQDTGTK